MQTNPYTDPNFYSNIHDETACINKYAPGDNFRTGAYWVLLG